MLTHRIDELLVRCLNHVPPPGFVPGLAGLSDEDWVALVRLAEWHGVAPLLLRRLKALAPAPLIPAAAAARLRESHQRVAMRNMLRFRELSRLLVALGNRGIEAMVLKGAYLSGAVYGDPGLRDMKDVDVLVRRRDLAEAYRVLLEFGRDSTGITAPEPGLELDCARHHHLPPVTMPNVGPVEMHWSLSIPDAPVEIDMDGVWARAVETRIAGVPALGLAPEDLLLHLSIHAALQHRFRMRLRHLCDIAMVLTEFRARIDWERLAVVANASGASRFVYCTVRVAENVLGAHVPAAGMDRLARESIDEAIVPMVAKYFLAASLELPLAYRAAREAEGFAQKAGIIFRSIAPAPARLRAMYGLAPGALSVYLYYPLRVADLVARRGRVLVEMARGSARFQLTLGREELAKKIDQWVDREADSQAERKRQPA